MEHHEDILGYMKYSGKMVEDGFLDARKSATALLGFDEAVRHFIKQDFPELDKLEYEIPVKIRKGSWEAIIPETIGQWILTGAGFAATAYATAAAAEMAKKRFQRSQHQKSIHLFNKMYSVVYQDQQTRWTFTS